MPGALVDTNILVYAHQPGTNDPRAKKAKKVYAERVLAGDGFVSVQNLAELSSVCLNKLKPPLDPRVVSGIVADISTACGLLQPSADTVKSALRGVKLHLLSFWDSMLWAIAKESGMDEILSEDLQDGQVIDGVKIRNPLKP